MVIVLHRAADAPAPTAYNLPTMASDLMKKRDVSRVGVFGSTTKRFYTPVANDSSKLPGPGNYDTDAAALATVRALEWDLLLTRA